MSFQHSAFRTTKSDLLEAVQNMGEDIMIVRKNVVINGITLTAKTLVLFGILQCFIFWQIQIILFVYSAMAEITLLRGSFPTQ